MNNPIHNRRRFLLAAGAAAAGAASALPGSAAAVSAVAMPERLQQVSTGDLNISYDSSGPEQGRPVVLLHDAFDGIERYEYIAKLLAGRGLQVLVPQLRGHGRTTFIDPAAPRASLPAALGKDAIGLIDALHMPEAVFAGIGWGAAAARAAALLKPTRCIGLLLVDGVQAGLAGAPTPAAPQVPSIQLASAEPAAFVDAVAALVRQGKWRT